MPRDAMVHRMAKNLTPKQQRFVDEYLKDLNASQACIRAGYSKKSAYSIGNENLSKPEIQEAIAKAGKERNSRTKLDADWLQRRLGDEVEADLADLYCEETGSLKPVHQWPKIWRQGLVSGVDVHQEYEHIDGEKAPNGIVTKLKLADRSKRLDMLGKHVNVQAFNEKTTVEVVDKSDILAKARARAGKSKKS